jgi:hypothetical protein
MVMLGNSGVEGVLDVSEVGLFEDPIVGVFEEPETTVVTESAVS